jgi:hypothetical protein
MIFETAQRKKKQEGYLSMYSRMPWFGLVELRLLYY